jgi:hypothetical protein
MTMLVLALAALGLLTWWAYRGGALSMRRRVLAPVCTVMLCAGGCVLVWALVPTHWVNKTPRFVLRAMLEKADAKPSQKIRLSADINEARSMLYGKNDRWERLRVQHAVAREISQWAEAVTEEDGPVDAADWPRLVAPADRVHLLYQSIGGLSHGEGWVVDEVKSEISQLRNDAGNSAALSLRFDWVLSELQFVGGGYSHRPDWAVVPDAVIVETLTHSDERVRLFGLERLGRRLHLRVMEKTMPQPSAMPLAQSLRESDPSEAVRSKAGSLLDYAAAFGVAE